jgi:tight adherence protein B
MVGLAAVAVLVLAPAGPARADDGLTVSVAAASAGQVRLTALVNSGADGAPPAITVSHDGRELPSTVAVSPSAPSPGEARAVAVVLDTGTAPVADALTAAGEAVLGYARAVPADVEVGVVTAADPPSVLVRPTRDRDAIRDALAALRAGTGRSAVAAARATAGELINGYGERRLLCVCDGRDPALTDGAAPAGTRLDVAALRPTADGLSRLRQFTASAGGGTVYPSASADELPGALRSAAAAWPLRLDVSVAVPTALAGSEGSLAVTAAAGTATLRATVPVRFAGTTPPTAGAAATAPAPPLAALRPSLLSILIFVAMLAAALLATAPLRRPVRNQRLSQVDRFRLVTAGGRPGAGKAGNPAAEGAVARAVLGVSGRVVHLGGAEGRIASALEQAGMTTRPHEWVVLRTCATMIGALLVWLLAGLPGVFLGALLGWAAAGLYRRHRASRRRRAFAEQLPDALQLVVGSLKSGFSLMQAFDAVSRELPPGPLTTEFGRVIAETRIGADISDALERVADRIGNEDLAWTVMAVRIQRETGGNLAEILLTTVDTLRERARLRGHVRALSAEGRLSAYILIGLPIVMGMWMFLVRREYLRVLWTTPTGLMMLIGAVVLMVIGSFWMSRWVKVEV